MELVSLAQEVLQNAAEHAASYRLGQSALRHLDRALWVVEKCARWAVPPPLDHDERPQPELVRPLPWVFFLSLLVTLRITRESISLVNLIMGKPPLRSADVVTYIQSKRRYLRTLKYQGGRVMRSRSATACSPWARLQSLLQFTMCFRRPEPACHNNNSPATDEIMVVKRGKRRPQASPPTDTTYERLIEHMMIELNADSDDDSSFTLTNATSIRSDRSEYTAESDQDTVFQQDITVTEPKDTSTPTKHNGANTQSDSEEDRSAMHRDNDNEVHGDNNASPDIEANEPSELSNASHTNKSNTAIENIQASNIGTPKKDSIEVEENNTQPNKNGKTEQMNGNLNNITPNQAFPNTNCEQNESCDEHISAPDDKETLSPKDETRKFLVYECTPQMSHRSPKNEKLANGRTVKSASAKKKGMERRDVQVSSNNSY